MEATVCCVLKGGGEYAPTHVYALWEMVKKHLPSCSFVCFADQELICDTIPLNHRWPGWWSKMEIFQLRGPVLYFDLDTILIDNCDDILKAAKGHPFVILRDVYRGRNNPLAMQSSVMYWEGDQRWIYEAYKEEQLLLPGGDQEYLESTLPAVTYWQDITNGIISYKAHYLQSGLQPENKVVIFHGKPRPWQQNDLPYSAPRLVCP